MRKLYSQIVGMPIFDEHSALSIALVQDVFVDSSTGKVIGFLIKNNRVVVPLDIERFSSAISVSDASEIVSLQDLPRVRQVAQTRPNFMGLRVMIDQQNIDLGRVVDFSIDTVHMALTSIHAAKSFFFFRYQERIIAVKQIVRVEKDIIWVKNTKDKIMAESITPEPSASPA